MSEGRKLDLIIECQKCGCPNRRSDKLCTYCRTELSSVPVQPSFFESVRRRLEYHANRLKFRFKTPRKASIAGIIIKLMLSATLAVALVSGGIYFLYASLNGAGFLSLTLGLLLTLYGGSLVRILFKSIADNQDSSGGRGGRGNRYH